MTGTETAPLRIRVTSSWGDFGFDIAHGSMDDFVRVVAALSRWHTIDIDSLVISERDPKTGRFKSRT